MSGGSWDYVCDKIDEAASRLITSDCPYRRQIGDRLRPFAKVLHDIEWADSFDYSQDQAMHSMLEFLKITPEEWNTEFCTRFALLKIIAKTLGLESMVPE
jgi:hypothetical protein